MRKSTKKVLSLVLSLAMIFSNGSSLFTTAAAADSGVTDTIVDTTVDSGVPVESITITNAPTSALLVGATLQLEVSVLPENSTDKSVTWVSSDPNLGTVDKNGLFTAKGEGKVGVKATSVSNPEVESDAALITVKKPSLPAAPKGEGKITFEVKNSAGGPEANCSISLTLEDPSYSSHFNKKTDSAGMVVFSDLYVKAAGATYRYNYSTSGGQTGYGRVTLSSKKPTETVQIQLVPVASLKGRVITQAAGAGIPGIYIAATPTEGGNTLGAYTDKNGYYHLRNAELNKEYTVAPASWSLKQYRIVGETEHKVTAPDVEGKEGEAPTFKLTEGLSLTGRVTLDGQTNNFSKAYVELTSASGDLIAEGYSYGEGGFGFEGAIKDAGEYTLSIKYLYDQSGWYTTDYEYTPVVVSVTAEMLNQDRITLDLEAKTKLKTSQYFLGEGNTLTANAKTVQSGDDIDFTGKFKNNGDETITATFKTTFTNATVRDDVDEEFREVTKTVTLKPGEHGRFFIRTQANEGGGSVTAFTKVTVNGITYDFAQVGVDVLGITLFTGTSNIKPKTEFIVYGEASRGSIVRVREVESNEILGTAEVPNKGSKYYNVKLPGFDEVGKYSIYAETVIGDKVAPSDLLTIVVSENPIEINTVQVDSLSYDDLPKNSRTGVRSFAHSVDPFMKPFPLYVRSTFTNDSSIATVTYQFAGNSFPASKESDGKWGADVSKWKGTGLQRLTAVITTTDGDTITLLLAEATVLIDPSGYITDADTGLPLAGAMVECLQKADGNWIRLDTEEHGQPANPWMTGEMGYYGWDVPDGTYKVVATKSGYETTNSEEIEKYRDGITVPMPALDVNMSMIPETAMSLTSLTSEKGQIDALFSRYLDQATISVKDAAGTAMIVSSEIKDNKIIITGDTLKNGVEYTVTFSKVTPKSGKAPSYTLNTITQTVVFSGTSATEIGVEFEGVENLISTENQKKVRVTGSAPAGSILKISATSKQSLPGNISLSPNKTSVFLDLSLLQNGVPVKPNGAVTITFPILTGLDGSLPILVVHYNANGTVKELIAATVNQTEQTFTFSVRDFSPFGFVNGTAKGVSGVTYVSSSGSSSYQDGKDFDNKVMYLTDGDIVYSSVVDRISGTDEVYTVHYRNKGYTFNGKNLTKSAGGVIYYSAREFMEKIAKITSVKAGETTIFNPETGGIGIDYDEPTDVVPRAIVPDQQQLAQTMSTETTSVQEAADTAPTTGWIVLVISGLVIAAGAGYGIWFRRKKNAQ